VSRLAGRRTDAVVVGAGGGPAETGFSLNFFDAVATLEGLRPLLANSPARRTVTVSSIASSRRTPTEVIEQCPAMGEPRTITAALEHDGPGASASDDLPGVRRSSGQRTDTAGSLRSHQAGPTALVPKGYADQRWAGARNILKIVAFGFDDSRAAGHELFNPTLRTSAVAVTPLRDAFLNRPEKVSDVLAWCIGRENSQ
jgi:hypothetical protein